LNKSSYTDLDRTSIKEVLGLAGELTDENLRNACFEALGIQYTHRALSAILSGLDEDLKAKILARGVAMSVEIQGGINEEQLLDKLVPSENDPLQALNVRIGWIKDKIREEFGKPRSDWVKRFLKCITGQPVLPAGNIKILVAQGVLCKANTCFNSLEIPLSCNIPPRNEPSLPPLSDKERFIENLEILMAQTDFELL
jgi:hypothetical protein